MVFDFFSILVLLVKWLEKINLEVYEFNKEIVIYLFVKLYDNKRYFLLYYGILL